MADVERENALKTTLDKTVHERLHRLAYLTMLRARQLQAKSGCTQAELDATESELHTLLSNWQPVQPAAAAASVAAPIVKCTTCEQLTETVDTQRLLLQELTQKCAELTQLQKSTTKELLATKRNFVALSAAKSAQTESGDMTAAAVAPVVAPPKKATPTQSPMTTATAQKYKLKVDPRNPTRVVVSK